jgi:tetratricopeptide (TPR) repeat protein
MFRTAFGRLLLIPHLIAIACVLQPWCNAQETDTQVQQHFLAAQHDQQQGLLDEAAKEYRTVLRLHPQLPEAYVNLGLVYFAQAKFEESERALQSANKLRPGMRGVSLWLGIDEVKLNHPRQAATLLREAIRIDPNEKLAQSWLGTALWDAGETDAALLQLDRATALFPDDPDLLFARGEAYGKSANEETEELLQESSGTALSDLIYGHAYDGEHEWKKAQGHLRRAIARDPHMINARLELANVFLKQTRIQDAQEQLDEALKLAPRSAAVLARSGMLLLLIQEKNQGLARIETALQVNKYEALDSLGLPVEDELERGDGNEKLMALSHDMAEKLKEDAASSPAKDAALAALYVLAGDDDAATRVYQRIEAEEPKTDRAIVQVKSRLAAAMSYMYQHQYERAEANLERWLAEHPYDRMARYQLVVARRHIFKAEVMRLMIVAPDSYHLHQLLGQLYVARDEDDKALAEYRAVAKAEPNLPGVHFWLGHLYWKRGDADHALAELTKELQIDPGNPEANGELGAVLVAENRVAEAIPHLVLAIKSKPDLWPAYVQLGRAYANEKKYSQAEAMLGKAIPHDPDGSAHYQLGMVLRAEGKTTQAAREFAEVRAIKNEQMTATSGGNAAPGANP